MVVSTLLSCLSICELPIKNLLDFRGKSILTPSPMPPLLSIHPVMVMVAVKLKLSYTLGQAWKKCLFPCKLGKISLQQGRFPSSVGWFPLCISLFFSLQITKFPGKELPVLPIFSTPALGPTLPELSILIQCVGLLSKLLHALA